MKHQFCEIFLTSKEHLYGYLFPLLYLNW